MIQRLVRTNKKNDQCFNELFRRSSDGATHIFIAYSQGTT